MATPGAQVIDPLIEMMCAAWVSVREQTEEDAGRWGASLSSPAAGSSEVARAAVWRTVNEEALSLLVRSLLETQFRLQMAQKSKTASARELQGMVETIAGFVSAVVSDAEAVCVSDTCAWRGTAADMGPSAACVKCGGAARPLQKLALVNGRGEALS